MPWPCKREGRKARRSGSGSRNRQRCTSQGSSPPCPEAPQYPCKQV
ncbi:MAG TPA: hypothetical protein VLR54_01355 [Methanobacteriaceae archaeon]|nr:hypothetical protein [Methanobacteriaceae archaeon]